MSHVFLVSVFSLAVDHSNIGVQLTPESQEGLFIFFEVLATTFAHPY